VDTPCRDTHAVPLLSIHRAFVVHLYADPDLVEHDDGVRGRIEHVVSGQSGEFESIDGLLGFVRRVLRASQQQPHPSD
jgi:hypothetical protein